MGIIGVFSGNDGILMGLKMTNEFEQLLKTMNRMNNWTHGAKSYIEMIIPDYDPCERGPPKHRERDGFG